LLTDPTLLGLQKLKGHGPGVVGLEQLGLLVLELFGLLIEAGTFLCGLGLHAAELGCERLFDPGAQFFTQLDGPVVVDDQVFDDGNQRGLALASVSPVVPT
jgi:hypothetical protein